MKDDLLEGFGSLRKDLKENGELKEVITKVRLPRHLLKKERLNLVSLSLLERRFHVHSVADSE